MAICSNSTICMGLRLAGVDSYHAETKDALPAILETLSDVGILIISNNLKSEELADFKEKNPQILILHSKELV